MASPKDRRRSERTPTASIPVQISDVNCELIDLSLHGAAVVHRSPLTADVPATMIFPSYGGIYVPCKVLRSIVQVRGGENGPEYVFRSAIIFSELSNELEQPLREFLTIQIARLEEQRALMTAGESEPE
ncbi:MAG TPA: PilZ domain-containing protein [Thermoanaerobaculia bacterium]